MVRTCCWFVCVLLFVCWLVGLLIVCFYEKRSLRLFFEGGGGLERVVLRWTRAGGNVDLAPKRVASGDAFREMMWAGGRREE